MQDSNEEKSADAAERAAEKLAEKLRWEEWRAHLERTYGTGAFVSRRWLLGQLAGDRAVGQTTTAASSAHTAENPAAPIRTAKSAAVQGSPSGISLEGIRADLGDCTRCELCKTRKSIVFGEGNPQARLMFIGEGPGEQEDLQGRPFVGKAGQLLDKIIEAMGLTRAEVYIANVVKCRPPGNRVPKPEEAAVCEPFLFRQIDVIRPAVMVALGGTALKCLLHSEVKISQLRGRFLEFRGAKLMPTFHPAFLLRNPEAKKEVWEDMKKVMHELEQ